MNGILRPIEPWNGLRVSAALKMELGEFAANLDDLDENSKRFDDAFMFTFSMPLELGLLIYPEKPTSPKNQQAHIPTPETRPHTG